MFRGVKPYCMYVEYGNKSPDIRVSNKGVPHVCMIYNFDMRERKRKRERDIKMFFLIS